MKIKLIILLIIISILTFNITIISNAENLDENYSISIENNVIYENNCNLNLSISNFVNNEDYKIKITYENDKVIEQLLQHSNEKISLKFENEGIKYINIVIYKNNIEEFSKTEKIYYIIPYKPQFLDELTNKGIQVHFRNYAGYENYQTSIDILKKLGIQNVRADLFYNTISIGYNQFNFTYYDNWIKSAKDNNINVLLEINGFETMIDTDEKKFMFEYFINEVMHRYPEVKTYEVLNEPNLFSPIYYTDKELENYKKLVVSSKKIANTVNSNIKIASGALANLPSNNDTRLSIREFFDKLTNNGGYQYSDIYSYHLYDGSIGKKQNPNMIEDLETNKKLLNTYGGFIRNYVTEYGVSVYGLKNEEAQANNLVQQTILMDKFGVDFSSIYNFWNIGTDNMNSEDNYGLVNNDYTPKLSFYSMKNYYQNTNGSEYVGYIDIADGLEFHVYNKDGNPLIITWSDNSDNIYPFKLNKMSAKDIYGNDLTVDETGNINIGISPVYIYNADSSYFYQAISNVINKKYDEFLKEFSNEIYNIEGFKEKIETLNISSIDEETAINLMKKHYNLGNILIEKYKSTKEIITLSSMLDSLDDIGDTYEDLVTISAKNAEINLSETQKLIEQSQELINNTEGYCFANKILDYSKDYYNTSNYINNLEEENNMKAGLIISKNLHSQLLASWITSYLSEDSSIVVTLGDIDQDGKITINDLAILKLHCINEIALEDEYLKAADLDSDNEVTINDLAIMKLILLEKKTI